MRKIFAVLITAIALSVSAGSYKWVGSGVIVTATTTPTTTLVPGTNYAYSVSLYNAGSETVFFTKATSTNGFVAATSIPLAGGMTYSSEGGDGNNEQKGRQITAITLATTNGTADVYVAFE